MTAPKLTKAQRKWLAIAETKGLHTGYRATGSCDWAMVRKLERLKLVARDLSRRSTIIGPHYCTYFAITDAGRAALKDGGK